ncbi:MAG: PAS domain S-box protein [Bacillota bacterium]
MAEIDALQKRLDEFKGATPDRQTAVPETSQRADDFCPVCDELFKSAKVLLECKDFKETSRAIFDSCKNLIGADLGFIGLLNEERTRYEALFLETGSLVCSVDPSVPITFRGLFAEACRKGEVICRNSFRDSKWDHMLPAGHVRLDNVLIAPLQIKDNTVGLLTLANKQGGFSEKDARIISAFSNMAAVSLHNNRTLELLINSEERFRSVAQSASDAIICFNRYGKIVIWNHAAQNMFGYEASEIVGKRFSKIIPKRFRPAYMKEVNELIRTEKSGLTGRTIEMVGLRKDSSEFPAEVSFSTWQAGGEYFFTNIVRDISERRRTEEALRTSENKYRTIFENSGTAIAIIEEDTTVSMANTQYAKLVGCTKEEIEGKRSWTEFVLEDDIARMQGYHRSRRIDPETAPRNYEFRTLDRNGNVKDTFITISMIPGTKQSLASLSDITSIKRAEKALRKQQKLVQTILEVTPDQFALKDQNLTYLAANQAFCNFLGKPAQEIIGRTDYDLFPPDEAQKYRQEDLAVMNMKETRLQEEETTGATGKQWLHVAKTPVIDDAGKSIGVLCSVRNISDLKRAQQALKDNEHFLSNVFESIQDGISILDTEFNLVRVNPTMERWYVHTTPLVGRKCWEAYSGRKERCRSCPTAETLKTGKPAYGVLPKLGPGKKPVGWLDVYCFPCTDRATGEIKGVIEYLHDITRRKLSEEELQRSFRRLQKTIEETIRAMARVVEMRDAYTAGHQRRVADLAGAIAREMGCDDAKVKEIHMAAIVHDIGKIGVPVEILNKPAVLSELEFNLIRIHPEVGYNILKTIEFPWPIAQVILQHHERLNGSGYPLGLQGENILPEARILAVADVVEAMASHRPYRPALGIAKALAEIEKNRGILYDPEVSDACMRLFSHRGFVLD